MKITEETYFDYLDNLLNAEEIKVFEDHLKNNPEAQEKLNQLKTLDSSISNNFNQEKFDRVTDKFNDQFNNLQNKLDYKDTHTNDANEGFFSKIFTPILRVPFQSKALLFAAAVGIFFIGNQQNINTPYTVKNDRYLKVSETLIDDYPKLFNENNVSKSVELKIEKNDYSAVSMPVDEKKSLSKKNELECPTNLDRKQIKISDKNENTNDNYYIYCGSSDANNWRLHHIEIQIGSEPIDITGNFKVMSDFNFIYLFPKK